MKLQPQNPSKEKLKMEECVNKVCDFDCDPDCGLLPISDKKSSSISAWC